MRIFSFYITVIFGILLSCFQEVNARLHKHKLDATKRIFRRNVDLSRLLGGNGGNGFPNTLSQVQVTQPQGNSVNYGLSGAGPSPSGGTPINLGSVSPALLSSVSATTMPPLPIPAAPKVALPEIFPKSPAPQVPSLPPLSLPGNDEVSLPDLANLFGQGEA